jgi:hypothetical protein
MLSASNGARTMAKNLPGVKVRLEESVTERTDDSLSMAPDSHKNLMLPASIIASRANRDACYMNLLCSALGMHGASLAHCRA